MKAKTAVELLIVAVVAVFQAGCGGSKTEVYSAGVVIAHESPKMLVVSVHEAARKKDYAALAEAMDGDCRGTYKGIIASTCAYIDALDSLGDLVSQKIGKEQGQKFHKLAQTVYAGMFPSPLEGAVADGIVDWKKVDILDEGNATAVMIIGQSSEFDHQYFVRQVKGSWYMSPRLKGIPPALRKNSYSREAKLVQGSFRKYTLLVNDLKKQISIGRIDAGNFDQEMSILRQGKAASQPAGEE